MTRRLLGAAFVLALVVGSLSAFEAEAVIKKIDPDKGMLVVHAGGKERTVKVARDLTVLDARDKELAGGLDAKELKEGAVVTISVEPDGAQPVIRAIRLGKRPGSAETPKGETFRARATIKAVDADKGTLLLHAGGQERNVKATADVKVLDEHGKPLASGLKAKELKEGAAVTVTVGRGAGGPEIVAIQLGSKPNRPEARPEPPVQMDTSRLKPLTELGKSLHQEFPGGLYPDGKNERPAAHEAAGRERARSVRSLDADGKPNADGKIVLLTVGMSNTAQASAAFKQLADADEEKNPRVVIVNGAQGGMSADRIVDPEDHGSGSRYWDTVDDRLKSAGVTRAQVQAVWIKQADPGPTQGFPGYARKLQGELAKIFRLLPRRFPNVKLVYLSSRTYGGYARSRLNPEPYAYESGFSVKWLIEQQLTGDAWLNYDPARGTVKAPWLSWGPYLWANGSTRRADGFSYEESDFAADGTHESASGQRKVGRLLLDFFKTDTTTKPWFVRR